MNYAVLLYNRVKYFEEGFMKYSIVAADFDDTLLRSDLTVSKYTKDVIERYEAAGGTFMISTGRMYGSILKSIKRHNLKGLAISYQGAMITDTLDDRVLFHRTIPFAYAKEQLKLLEKETESVQIYYNDTLYVNKKTANTKKYEEVCEVEAVELNKTLSEHVLSNKWDVTKILAVMPPKKVKERFEEFSKVYGDFVDFSVSKPYFFEVVAKGVSKGSAIKKLCGSRGLDSSDVITFGDGINDISMLEYADLSFAVANGQKEAKKAAKFICPSNDEDGVAKMIEKYCL